MDLRVDIISKAHDPPKPQKPAMKDIFILPKSISKMKPVDKQLEMKNVATLKKMAKKDGVRAKVANKMRKTGLVDVLGKDSKKHFAVPSKGEARVGKKPGKRLAYDKKKRTRNELLRDA